MTTAKEVNMCRLNTEEVEFFSACGFKIVRKKAHYIEIKAESGQYWCIYKEDENVVILLHKHKEHHEYHMHYVFDSSEKAISEIFQHERYIKKRNREKERICGSKKLEFVF